MLRVSFVGFGLRYPSTRSFAALREIRGPLSFEAREPLLDKRIRVYKALCNSFNHVCFDCDLGLVPNGRSLEAPGVSLPT